MSLVFTGPTLSAYKRRVLRDKSRPVPFPALGAQPEGVSRKLTQRRESARNLQLQDTPLVKMSPNENVRTRGDEARKGGRRPAPAKQQQLQLQQLPAAPRKEAAAAVGPIPERAGYKTIDTSL